MRHRWLLEQPPARRPSTRLLSSFGGTTIAHASNGFLGRSCMDMRCFHSLVVLCLVVFGGCVAESPTSVNKADAVIDRGGDICFDWGFYADGDCDCGCAEDDVSDCEYGGACEYCWADDGNCSPPTNPCATVLCAPGTQCELQQVHCIRAPCPPIPICRPIPNPCATPDSCGVRCDYCPSGQICTAVIKSCQPDGSCSARVPMCDEQRCGTRGAPECGDFEFCDLGDSPLCGALDHGGVCREQPTADSCYETFDGLALPVCGCDDVTYGSECLAHAAGVSVKNRGVCETTPEVPCASPGSCGTRCDSCPPGHICTAVIRYCQDDGSCSPAAPICSL